MKSTLLQEYNCASQSFSWQSNSVPVVSFCSKDAWCEVCIGMMILETWDFKQASGQNTKLYLFFLYNLVFGSITSITQLIVQLSAIIKLRFFWQDLLRFLSHNQKFYKFSLIAIELVKLTEFLPEFYIHYNQICDSWVLNILLQIHGH